MGLTGLTAFQTSFFGVVSVLALLFSVTGTGLLLKYGDVVTPANGEAAFRLQIFAAPLAVLAGIISVWMQKTALRNLRYVAYGLALIYATQSDLSVGQFRALTGASSQDVMAYVASYIGLAIMLVSVGCIVQEPVPPHRLGFSCGAVTLYLIAVTMAGAGCFILWWQEGVNHSITNYSDYRKAAYSGLGVPAVVNVMVLFGGVFYQSIEATFGSLLITGSSHFWTLSSLFAMLDALSGTKVIFIIGASLCWSSSIVLFLAAFLAADQHRFNSPDPDKVDSIYDRTDRSLCSPLSILTTVLAAVLIIAGTIVIYAFDINVAGQPQHTSLESNFLDSAFPMALLLVSIAYLATNSKNYDHSKYRYVILGIFVFIPHYSDHRIIDLVNHAHDGISFNDTIGNYTHTEVGGIAIGESVSYVGLMFLLMLITGFYRKNLPAVGIYTVAIVATIVGLLILLLSTSVVDYSSGSALPVTTIIIQNIAVPVSVVALLMYCGFLKTSHEAYHAALFCIGYSGLWILPYCFAAKNLLTGSSAAQAFAGGIMCFATVLYILCLVYFGDKYHQADKVNH